MGLVLVYCRECAEKSKFDSFHLLELSGGIYDEILKGSIITTDYTLDVNIY